MIHPFHYTTAQEALKLIKTGNRIFIHGSACTPLYLLRELAKEKEKREREIFRELQTKYGTL